MARFLFWILISSTIVGGASGQKAESPLPELPADVPKDAVIRMVLADKTPTGQDAFWKSAGKFADLLLVNGDPTKNIGDIRRVELVFKGGSFYRPAELYRAYGIRPE